MALDPVSITLMGNGVIKAIELGWQAFRSRRTGESDASGELRRTQELALHYWGCLLHEMRAGCERVRFIVEAADRRSHAYAPFDFTVSDALMPDFCRVVPSPPVLARFQRILAAQKRIDFFQRVAAQATPLILGGRDPQILTHAEDWASERAQQLARDAIGKDVCGRFNTLVQVGHSVGRSVYESDWAGDAGDSFPAEIAANDPINHDLI
jgi:hypothetical protein